MQGRNVTHLGIHYYCVHITTSFSFSSLNLYLFEGQSVWRREERQVDRKAEIEKHLSFHSLPAAKAMVRQGQSQNKELHPDFASTWTSLTSFQPHL